MMRIAEIDGLDGGEYRVQELFGFRQAGVADDGTAKGEFYSTGNTPRCMRRLHELGIELPADLFCDRTIG
ncbi:MAG: hypothetical protein R3C10_05390 [Pirellulales bacterium]